jgi:RNA recognition motif-containing protein
MSEEQVSTATTTPYEPSSSSGAGSTATIPNAENNVNSQSQVAYSSAPSSNHNEVKENKIFIGGLSWQTTIDGMKFYFEKFGELSDVALMTDKHTGQPRGFGFITMVDSAGIVMCI